MEWKIQVEIKNEGRILGRHTDKSVERKEFTKVDRIKYEVEALSVSSMKFNLKLRVRSHITAHLELITTSE